jgi:hypothetical protein
MKFGEEKENQRDLLKYKELIKNPKILSRLYEPTEENIKQCAEYIKKGVEFVKSIPEKIKSVVYRVLDFFDSIYKWIKDKVESVISFVKKVKEDPVGVAKDAAKSVAKSAWDTVKGWAGFSEGGFVPGEGNGDTVPAMLTPGEYVVPKKDIIKAKPVGQNDFTYKPGNTEVSKVGDSTVTVKDFNINLGGTLRLDAGSSSANINMNELMRDPVFIDKMKGIIEDSVSNSYYGGRRMNDLASKRGMFVQSGTIGRNT